MFLLRIIFVRISDLLQEHFQFTEKKILHSTGKRVEFDPYALVQLPITLSFLELFSVV